MTNKKLVKNIIERRLAGLGIVGDNLLTSVVEWESGVNLFFHLLATNDVSPTITQIAVIKRTYRHDFTPFSTIFQMREVALTEATQRSKKTLVASSNPSSTNDAATSSRAVWRACRLGSRGLLNRTTART